MTYSLGVNEYDDPLPGYNLKIHLRKLRILKRTPQGAWVSLYGDHFEDKKFVRLTARKRYACQTKQEALKSFRARKLAQIRILEGQMKKARLALKLALEVKEVK